MGTLLHCPCTRNVDQVHNVLHLLSMLQEMFCACSIIHAIDHVRLSYASVSSLVCATPFGMLNLIKICRILQC